MDEKENSNPESTENRNLQKLALVFDDGFSLGNIHSPILTPQSITALPVQKDDFKPPTLAPSTQTRIPCHPVDINTAKNLRLITLGYASHSFTNDWKKFFFSFRETKSGIPYGLDASLPGPRALTLCVQAWVLKNMMFASDGDERQYYGKETPKPSQNEQTSALVDALVDVLWRVAPPLKGHSSSQINVNQPERRQIVVTLMGHELCFQTKRSFVEDGFTEKLWIFTMNTKQELKMFMRRNVHYFCNRLYPGAIMLLYSVVLSRTFDVIMKDMGSLHTSLLTDNARTTQSLINLLLTGNAAPHLHNGVIRCNPDGRTLDHPLPGLRTRSTIGFLFFNKNENEKKRTQVGSMYKTPRYPVWVTQVNGTYGLIFCTARDLVTDWKTERLFNLHYYNGHFTQNNETLLTLDTRTRAECINVDRQITIWDDEEEKEKKQPSLEKLLFTKWPGAEIDWNGESPYY